MRAKPESTIISWKSRARNLIVLVELDIKLEILNKKFRTKPPGKKTSRKMINVLLLAIYRGTGSK